jgi:hypothetical protein
VFIVRGSASLSGNINIFERADEIVYGEGASDHPPGQGVVEPGEKSEGKVDAESQSHGRQVNGNGFRAKIHKESSND